jgi:hypothetical protein
MEMKAEDVARAAQAFLSSLPTFGEGLVVKEIECQPRLGPMNKIFQREDTKTGGVYWFSWEGGEVFDIGKSDANVWERICKHVPRPEPLGELIAGGENPPPGEGWSFPTATHLKGGAGSDAARQAILHGRFYVGWLKFEPGYVSTLVEVYLQTLCLAVDGRLPEFCLRIG